MSCVRFDLLQVPSCGVHLKRLSELICTPSPQGHLSSGFHSLLKTYISAVRLQILRLLDLVHFIPFYLRL